MRGDLRQDAPAQHAERLHPLRLGQGNTGTHDAALAEAGQHGLPRVHVQPLLLRRQPLTQKQARLFGLRRVDHRPLRADAHGEPAERLRPEHQRPARQQHVQARVERLGQAGQRLLVAAHAVQQHHQPLRGALRRALQHLQLRAHAATAAALPSKR